MTATHHHWRYLAPIGIGAVVLGAVLLLPIPFPIQDYEPGDGLALGGLTNGWGSGLILIGAAATLVGLSLDARRANTRGRVWRGAVALALLLGLWGAGRGLTTYTGVIVPTSGGELTVRASGRTFILTGTEPPQTAAIHVTFSLRWPLIAWGATTAVQPQTVTFGK
ncbi:hypothetical protein [Lacticaseibacillus suihuaensis]